MIPATHGIIAGSAWSPLALAPNVWSDASQETLSNGDALASIADFSGNGRALTQSNPSACGTFATASIGGRPEFRFDGVDDTLSRADVAGYTLNGPLTMWLVGRLRGSLSARVVLMSLRQPGSPGNYVMFDVNTYLTAGNRMGFYATSNTFDSNFSTSTLPFALVVSISSAAAGSNIAASATYTIGGVTSPLVLRSGSGVWANMAGMNQLQLGSVPGSAIGIGEAGLVNRSITGAEMTSLTNYLAAKWSL